MADDESSGIRIIHDVRIPLRDGVRLAGNLYLPATDDPVPAILQYTPYLKDGHGGRGAVDVAHRFFARHGYACLTLDMRGYGASDGTPAPPFADVEKQDGAEAVAWIAAQPWCNGRVGMWGVSYGGDTALAVASTRPPALKAIVPIHATDDEFVGVCYPHGCRQAGWAENDWGLRMVGYQLLPPLRFDGARDWIDRWRARLADLEPCLFAWHTIPPATWTAWRTDVTAIQAATYLVSAWHDCYPGETLRIFNAVNAPKRVLIGPWKHEHPDWAVIEPIGFLHEMLRWWDCWLRDIDTGILAEPPIVVYDQPRDGWRSETAWPPPVELRDLFIQPVGTLGPTCPDSAGVDARRVDPTIGLTLLPWDWTTPAVQTPPDIASDDHRALTYTTAPLDADLHILGNPEVVVHLSADQPDFPLVAWLSDVAPTGSATLICQGWVRPLQVIGRLLQSDRVETLTIPLKPTSYRLPAGHRLRLAIAGSLFPTLVPAPVNPVLSIHYGPGMPSRLRLPLATIGQPTGRPVFRPPIQEQPTAQLLNQADHTISRDLLGRTATHVQRRRTLHRLEDGGFLQQTLETRNAVDARSPADLHIQGTWTATIERPVNTVVVRVDVLETFDQIHLAARITLDGQPFYERTWDLDLRSASWNLQSPRVGEPTTSEQTRSLR